MLEAPVKNDDTKRTQRWDAFLDAYSVYLRDPSLANAAALHLAGVALETTDERFSLQEFETGLGWPQESGQEPAK
jgi:hypothetical protein